MENLKKWYVWLGVVVLVLIAIWYFFLRKKGEVINAVTNKPTQTPIVPPTLFFIDDNGVFLRMKLIDEGIEYPFGVIRNSSLLNIVKGAYRIDSVPSGNHITITIYRNNKLILSKVLDITTYEFQ